MVKTRLNLDYTSIIKIIAKMQVGGSEIGMQIGDWNEKSELSKFRQCAIIDQESWTASFCN